MRLLARFAALMASAVAVVAAADIAWTKAPAPARASAAQQATTIPPTQLEAFVDGVVRTGMADQHIAGVAVTVVQNGQVLLKKGYGFATMDPATPVDPDKTLFRLASISKTFTWIAVMKESEAGHLRLTAPVNLYLPEAVQVRDQGFKRPVLIRDLMTHTPGFEDRALGQLFEKDPARVRPLVDYLREERPRRVREPGQTPVYSNYGAALAGEAVSYVSGRRYQDVVENEIIRPLGLAHTTFREPYPARADLPAPMPTELASTVSTGYRWAGGSFRPQTFEYATQVAPAAALSSTAGDMARYMEMILGGGQLDGVAIYDADTAQGFRTTLQSAAPGVNGFDNGFMEFSLPGGFRGQGHNGDTLWFHSSLVTVPALGLGIFVTTNTDTGDHLASELPKRIVAQFYGPATDLPRPGVPALVDDRATYEGTYLNDRRAYSGLEKFVLMLVSEAKVRVTKDGRLLTSGGRGAEAKAWIPDGPPGHFRETTGPATMAFDVQDGRAVRWYPASGTTAYERIGLFERLGTLEFIAALAALASIVTLVGHFFRDRQIRQTPLQGRASLVQSTIAILWLIAMVSGGAWGLGANDMGKVMYQFPGALLLIASACALVAALLTLVTLGMSPMVWRGGRRVDSWDAGRKLRFSATTAIFAAFAFILMWWGALEPWSR
jgi:CubicO group peptidase (beta-lactamase class C family)